MATDLSKVTNRDGLKPRRDPYWQRLRPGCFVGYRALNGGGLGTWVARAYDEESQGYKFKAMGDFGDKQATERFAAAKAEAEAFAVLVERGGVAEPEAEKIETVAEACRAYAKAKGDDSGARFELFVYNDPIGRVKLAKLRRSQLAAWRTRVEETPASVARRADGTVVTRPRAASTVNRDLGRIAAALNKAIAHGTPNTESAWQEALVKTPNADGQRTTYLDKGQRRAMLDAVAARDPEALPFFKTLCLLPLRPGAAAQLTVKDWEPRTSELTVGKDKNGKPRRAKLPADIAALFNEQVKDKLPGAYLLARADGSAWNRNSWRYPINAAAKAAKLPEEACTYTLRHSTITDLVNAGLPLLTIGQISDTSVEMIQKHYGHLTASAAVEALAGLAL